MKAKVLIAGSDGYIGSVLTNKLNDEYSVIGYDTNFYNNASLYHPKWKPSKLIKKDIRLVSKEDLYDVSAIICLADLSDPTSQEFPEVTRSINYRGLAKFATMAKKAGVKKFIYASSSSVYGYAEDEIVAESDKLSPLTPYAECKVAMEKHLISLCDTNFGIACLRNATVYGLSPHMRFDLVLNYLCATAITKKTIELKSDGKAWRPFVHIEDLCDVFVSILGLPINTLQGLIVNVGNGATGNYRIIDIARLVEELSGCKITYAQQISDKRSYRINSDKLQKLGISCDKNMRTEISKMLSFFRQIELKNDDVNLSSYNRLEQIRFLLKTKQVDKDLMWTKL